MRKTLVTLASCAAMALGVAATPNTASAHPAVLVPWLVAAGVGGLALGAAAANARPVAVTENRAYYDEPAPVVGAPAVGMRDCYPARARVNGAWRRVQICQ
ncbi:hypothetical protein [Terrarubrum flagellatum]|uniref:hypothetical protein n=1 Tax=Terrirubrum flagellatum TaxID=2895980 RepID=UPI0031450D3A